MQANQEDRIRNIPQAASHTKRWIAFIALTCAAGGAYYSFNNDSTLEPQTTVETSPIELPEPAPTQPLPVVEALPEPEVVLPAVETVVTDAINDSNTPSNVEVTETPPALPALSESDPYVTAQTIALANGMSIGSLLISDNIIARFVTFIDNLAQGNVARKSAPMHGPDKKFTVLEVGNKTYLDPDSYRRYDLYADFIASLSPQQLVATYQHLLPLFNEAYAELGYEEGNFDARLKQAFAQLKHTPIITAPIEVNTVSVSYKFVDPQLENLSTPQKQLLRMGPDNIKKIQKALLDLEQALK